MEEGVQTARGALAGASLAAGSTGALTVMTIVSVAIGYAFKHVPEVQKPLL